jgi:hypothetical protein
LRRHRFWISGNGVLVYHCPWRACIGYLQWSLF